MKKSKRSPAKKKSGKKSVSITPARGTGEKLGVHARAKKPRLLSGGNPQIAKADGDAPVQAYIEALSGWKRDAVRRVDALVTKAVPQVRKAVKWNSPMYGMIGQGWFLSLHTFAKYIKVAFFNGASLTPVPPVDSTSKNTRYLHIEEGESLNEAQLKAWVKQASKLPGWGKS